MYSEKEIQEFWEMYKSGMSCSDIARRINVSRSHVVRNIYRRFPDEKLEIGLRNKNSKISKSLNEFYCTRLTVREVGVINYDLIGKCNDLIYNLKKMRKRIYLENLRFNYDYVVCPFCGYSGARIDNHIKTFHNIKLERFRRIRKEPIICFNQQRVAAKNYQKKSISELNSGYASKVEEFISNWLKQNNLEFLNEFHPIPYFDSNRLIHRTYFPDFYVPSLNLVIEAYNHYKDDKFNAVKSLGYNYCFISNSEDFDTIKRRLENACKVSLNKYRNMK